MDNPYISHSYMTYLMEDEEVEGGGEEEKEGERGGGGGHNPISKQSINFDGG